MTSEQARIFICYARADSSEFVDTLYSALVDAQFNPWMDRQRLVGGEEWQDDIHDAIVSCDALVVVLSPHAVNSKQVKREYRFAQERGKRVVPVMHITCEPSYEINSLNYLDFRPSFQSGFESLLGALRERPQIAHDPIGPSFSDQPPLSEARSSLTIARQLESTSLELRGWRAGPFHSKHGGQSAFYDVVKRFFGHVGYQVEDMSLNSDLLTHLKAAKLITERGDNAIYVAVCFASNNEAISARRVRESIHFLQLAGLRDVQAIIVTNGSFTDSARAIAVASPNIELMDIAHLMRYVDYLRIFASDMRQRAFPPPSCIFAADAMRLLPGRLPSTKILSIVQHKGGVGKTTSTLYLASLLAARGERVLVVDLDPQANLTACLPPPQGINSQFTLSDYWSRKCDLADTVSATRVSNIWIIPGDKRAIGAPDHLSPTTELQFTAELRSCLGTSATISSNRQFSWVIVDTLPALNGSTHAALLAADYVIVPFNIGPFASAGIKDTLLYVEAIRALTGTGVRVLGGLITQWRQEEVLESQIPNVRQEFLEYDLRLLATRIPLDREIDTYFAKLISGVVQSSGKARKAYQDLLREIEMMIDEV